MKHKKLATLILKRLFENSYVSEIVYPPIPKLFFIHQEESEIKGRVYLNIESRWSFFNSPPEYLPNSEDDFPQTSPEEEKNQLSDYLLSQQIVNVKLGNKHPHLIFTLENGKLFLVNGINLFECWQAGISDNPKESCQIIACPGGEIAIWKPKTFSY